MRYQSPTANPLSHYWEEDVFIGSPSRLCSSIVAKIRIFSGEYFLANIILLSTLIGNALAIRPVSSFISALYRTYGIKWGLKRLIDIVGAIVGIIISSPFYIMMPILIKLDSPGPVFFCQKRVGKNRRRRDRRLMSVDNYSEKRTNDRRNTAGFGRSFMVIKFRTMRMNAEKHTGPVLATQNDPRITRLGSFLRATRIDELPQFFNILKGDMSLVGPRPEREFFIGKLKNTISNYEQRLLVKPGLTGLAQVEAKYEESIDDTKVKVKYDLDYIQNLNIFRDIKIIFKTVYVVLAAKGM